MAKTLKRKKPSRWRLSVELITKARTYSNSVTIETTGGDPFDEAEKNQLFEGAGVPEDLGPDDLQSLTFQVERL